MSTDVAIYQASVPDRMRYAEALSGASLLPNDYRGKPANVLLALEYGAALGIAPMVAIQGVHVINGKPTASAGLIGALVRKAGHRLRVTGDDRHAVAEIVRGDDPDFTFRSEWTMERAQQAKLTGKDTWKNFPAAMLKARAITEVARDACPEALSGVQYTAEELGSDDVRAEAYPMTSESAAQRPVSSGEGEGSASGVDAPYQRTADSEPDIVDAVIVDDETPAGATEGEAEAPAGQPHPAAESAFRGLQAALSERQKAEGWTRADVIGWVGLQVGRPITSTKDLERAEVEHVRAVLRKARREVAA